VLDLKQMENKGLIFIPDISGFTKFVSELEIDHSKLIIKELLELLINSNSIGLTISEIEGDAILFYRFGESPDIMEIYKQVEKMFCEFHKQINAYDHRKYCHCTACMSAINLSLKIITHYGEFTGYNVHNFNKLIGKDINIAHQLLKNDIHQHEYWLVTKNLSNNGVPPGLAEWMKWNTSTKQTEGGEIPFYYAQLGPLKNEIEPDIMPKLDLTNHVKIFSVSREYDADIIRLFHATGDFNYRNRWQEGVKTVEEVGHFLPRIGMRCKCMFENGQEVIFATSYSYSPDWIEFGETDENSNRITYYTLEKKGRNKSKLTIDYYLPKNISGAVKLSEKTEETFRKSLENLVELVKEDI